MEQSHDCAPIYLLVDSALMFVKKPPAKQNVLLAEPADAEQFLCDVASYLVELHQGVMGLRLANSESLDERSKSLELSWVAATRLAVELKMAKALRDIAAASGSSSSLH